MSYTISGVMMSLNLTTLMSKNQISTMKHYLETELGQVMMMRSLMTAAAVRESTESSRVQRAAQSELLQGRVLYHHHLFPHQ